MSPQLARLGTRVRSLLRHGPRLAALADALVHAPADGPVLVDADGTLTGAQLADEIRVARPPDSPSLLRIPGHHHRATIIRMLGAALAGWDVMVLHPDDSTLTDPPGAVAGRGRLWLGTSGTTGARQHSARPSYGPGLLLPVGQLWAAWQLGKPGAILVQPALHHGYGLGIALAGLLAQRPLLLPGSKNVVGDMIAAHHPTVTASVPPQLASLPEVPGWRPAVMITGSGPLSAEVQHRAMETFGPVLHNLFGSTEAGFATMATPQDLQRSPGCVGRPLRGVRARLSEGRLEVRSPFATQRRGWVPTGDYGLFTNEGVGGV